MGARKYTVESIAPRLEPFLRSLLNHLRVKVSFQISPNEKPHPDFESAEVMVRFSGEDVDQLLANKLELLLALEHLGMEMLRMPLEDHAKLCFDANDYRILRVEELRLTAQTAAERVKSSRSPFQFNPMNSRERRILHLALRNEPAVRSESLGIEPYRHVVIYPAGMASMPQPPAPPPRRGRR